MKFLVHVPGAKDGHRFFLNEQKFLKNLSFFTEKKTISSNEQFYWTIVQRGNKQNRWKMKDNLRKNEIIF